MSDSIYDDVYHVVKQIPEGKVATYGQIAHLIGRPRHARQVGYALSALGGRKIGNVEDNVEGEGEDIYADVPWHRVINAKGEVSKRAHPDYEDYQRLLLEEEGVEIGLQGTVPLKRYQWQP